VSGGPQVSEVMLGLGDMNLGTDSHRSKQRYSVNT